MAGSYNHVVDTETGKLLDGEGINAMLECRSGDVVECVEEMYGMIWYLADRVEGYFSESRYANDDGAAHWVEEARKNYREGLRLSPGTDAHLDPEDED
jgi:hypothetical protein